MMVNCKTIHLPIYCLFKHYLPVTLVFCEMGKGPYFVFAGHGRPYVFDRTYIYCGVQGPEAEPRIKPELPGHDTLRNALSRLHEAVMWENEIQRIRISAFFGEHSEFCDA